MIWYRKKDGIDFDKIPEESDLKLENGYYMYSKIKVPGI